MSSLNKSKFCVYVICFIFGLAMAFVLALANSGLSILSWIVYILLGGILGLVVGGIIAVLYKFNWSGNWSGFREKKLWDWMELLIIPVLLTAASFLFEHLGKTISGEEKVNDAESKQQQILNSYYDKMKIYLDKQSVRKLLHQLNENRDIRNLNDDQLEKIELIQLIATPELKQIESLTYTILKALDNERKSQVLDYLYETGLVRLEIPTVRNRIGGDEIKCTRPSQELKKNYVYESAIHLENVNLDEIDLRDRDLKYINLCRAKLTKAKLSKSDLSFANINEADLNEANLDWAKFYGLEFDYVEKINQKYLLTMLVQNDSKTFRLYLQHHQARTVDFYPLLFSNDSFFLNGRFFSRDLSNANLQRLDLSGVNLSRFNLENSDLSEANLTGANLSEANLKNVKADFVKIKDTRGLEHSKGLSEKLQVLAKLLSNKIDLSQDLRGKDLSNINLDNQDLTDADLTGTNLEGASMKGTKLIRANLTEANLRKIDLTGADLTNTTLVKTNLQNSTLIKARLDRAKLTLANFQSSSMQEATMHDVHAYSANFDRAKMSRVQLIRTNLNSCSMRFVDLNDANLTEAALIVVDLIQSTLQRANMKGANLTNSKLISVDLSDVKKISEVKFENTEYFDTIFPSGFNPKKYPKLKEISASQLFSNLDN